MSARLVILGAGGYGRTVADVAAQSGRFAEIVFLDDHAETPDVVGRCADFAAFQNDDTTFYPAFGNNEGRLGWLHRLEESGCKLLTLIHPTAYVSPTVTLGAGTVVLPKAVINTGTVVKKGCIVNCGALVDHGCVLEAGVHVCLGAIVKAENRIPSCKKIEAGEVVQNRTFPVEEKQ